LPCDDAK